MAYTIIDDMYEGKYIQTCTPELALSVGLNLRYEDRRETEQTTGLTAEASIIESFYNSTYSVYFTVPNGKAAGVAGVTPHNVVWMLCTDASTEYPHTFVREAKRWIDKRTEPLLWNICDKRNTAHLRLLKFLGFKFLREVLHGPNYLPFIEFCKIPCAQK